MFLTLAPEQFKTNNILFSEKVDNKVINNSDFYRIIYSDDICVMSGLHIHFDLVNINIERYFNKIKCCILDNNNTAIIQILKDIESHILDKFNITKKMKKPVYNIAQQLKNNFIKIYTNKYISYGEKSNLSLLLKISGIWESVDEYGITFRFFIS
tara:strand:+ start:1243 stop:1707 length:465 start_codon:yes stop_codon:yes gene_type:complete